MARSRGVYNRTFTPELWEKVNPVNKAILDDFVAEYRQRKKAKGTIDGYFQDLRIILIHILENYNNKSILEMNKKDFRNISIWLSEDSNLSSNRVNRMKSAINSMLTFCEDDDEYDYEVNYAKKVVGLPKELVKTNEDDFFITFDEFIKVREKLVEQGDLQTAVMFSLFYDSGGRRAEIWQIAKQGLLDGNKTNVVRGKRGKLFQLVYLDDTRDLIKQYLDQRGEDNIDSLWISKIGDKKEPVKKEALYTRMLKCSKILSEIRGEECNIFPHSMRHSRIECLISGQDNRLKNQDGTNRVYTLEEVQTMAHHSDSNTTKLYCKDKSEDMIDDMFGFNKPKDAVENVGEL